MKYILKFLVLIALLMPVLVQAQDVKVKDVQVSVEEENGYKKITIKKTLEDGTIDIINWEGTGEIPEDIAKEFGPGGGIIVVEEGNDSTKVITKKVTVIVDEKGKNTEEKQMKVIVREEGENVIHLGEDEEIIILKEGEETDEKEVKIWIEKVEGGDEKQMKVRVHRDKSDVTNGAKEEVVIITMDNGSEEKIIINKENPLPEVPKIERSLKLKDLQVSPNPASERINLQFKAKKAPITIRMFDAAGREVYKEFLRDFDGNYQNRIELDGVTSDFFFISIEQKGKVYTEKIIQR